MIKSELVPTDIQIEPDLNHLHAVYLWAGYLASLCLSFL